MQSLEIHKSSQLIIFEKLTSLKKLLVKVLDDVENIEEVIDFKFLTFLSINEITQKVDTSILGNFKNVMELQLKSFCEKLELELFLPKMENLSNLYLVFNTLYYPLIFSRIYNYCKSLHTLQIDLIGCSNYAQFFEDMIEHMKSHLIQRNSPLKLVFLSEL